MAAVRRGTRVRVPRHVVCREFPAQTVILNLNTGRYHGLDPTAGRMLAQLDQTSSLAVAARVLAERYERPRATVERDLCELCARLLDRGLIELVETATG